MWEQRYEALRPNRTKGNTRHYDGDQLRRLLNIVSLLGLDYKISKLARLPDAKLFGLVRKIRGESVSAPTKYFVPQFISVALNFDEPAFEKLFSHCLLRFGIKKTYTDIICPMLVQIGMLWSVDELPPANEHFISNLIRQKLHTSIDSLPPQKNGVETWLLFLPENEFHDVGLLYANYLIKEAGKKTIYLGPNVPAKSLHQAIGELRPEKLLCFLTHNDAFGPIETYFKKLKKNFNGEALCVAGNNSLLGKLKIEKGILKLNSVAQLEKQLI